MSSSRGGYAHVGNPPQNYQEWETLKFRLHDFEGMPSTKGHMITTPEITCFGQRWALQVYPGGDLSSKNGMISIFLKNCSENSGGSIQFAVSIKEDDGGYADGKMVSTEEFQRGSGTDAWGWTDFYERSLAIDALVDGTLFVDVSIKPKDDCLPLFIPKNPFRNAMRKLFLNKKYADVLFRVGSQEEEEREQHEATKPPSSFSFYAHRMVLEECAPALADICENGEDLTPVPITDVRIDIFRLLLSYVYGWSIPMEELEKNAKEYIDAADLYGVVNLKLQAEAIYATSTDITADNVMDILLHADAKNCALMKEVALDFIAENGAEVLDRVNFDDIPGSLFKDLLVTTTRRENKNSSGESDNDAELQTMRVSLLRRKLYAKGMNIDGSRETMIAALKDAR
ncbi:hypothetical protein ACHAXR_012950 [Thalassiosira sp. AJA248-18]